MKIKLLSTAMALALATTMAPVFGQQSGGGNSDGGGAQGIGAESTVERNAPGASPADRSSTQRPNDRSNDRAYDRSRDDSQSATTMNRDFSLIEENHKLNVEHL